MLELEALLGEARGWLPLGGWEALLFSVLLVINAVTVGLYAHDKRAARRRGARRISERTLHLFELIGGWPGALFAQRWLRHKTIKPGYRRVFYRIVALHLLLSCALLVWWATG